MIEDLVSFVREIAARQGVDDYDEATTQQCVILPVFRKLGWNDTDPKEVTTQYSVGGGRCDYALAVSTDKKVLCEVKAPSESDLSKHEQQLVRYAFERGAELAVLTNGVSWWFYLPMLKVPWERRKFFTVDIRSQSPEDAAERLEDFLAKGNVKSGKAVTNAEEAQRGREKKESIERNLPDAWREIVDEPDEGLMAILCERVEKMCGFRPALDQAREFLKSEGSWRTTRTPASSEKPGTPKPVTEAMTPKEQSLNARLATLKTHKDVEAFLREVEAAGCGVYTRFIGREAVEFRPTEDAKRPCMDYVKLRGDGRRAKGQCYVDLLHGYLVVRVKPTAGNPYYSPRKAHVSSSGKAAEVRYGKVPGGPLKHASFRGKELVTSSWRRFYASLCEEVYSLHSKDFERVLELKGAKGQLWFSKNPRHLACPIQVASSGIYLAGFMGQKTTMNRARRLLDLFGHPSDELRIETK